MTDEVKHVFTPQSVLFYLSTNIILFTTTWHDKLGNNTIVFQVFSKQTFYELTVTDRELFDEYVDAASTYSSLLKQRLLITAGLTGSQRLLNWLDKLCQCSTSDSDGSYTITCNMTQQQIADFPFIHVTTCNKLFSKLNRDNIVKYFHGKIVIYDYAKLKDYLVQNWTLL